MKDPATRAEDLRSPTEPPKPKRLNSMERIAQYADANPGFERWMKRYLSVTNGNIRLLPRLRQLQVAQSWFVPPEGYTITQRADGRFEATGPDGSRIDPPRSDSYATRE
jgi:hypothetical protein